MPGGGDSLALAAARRLRRKALLISLVLQAALLAALILQPLVATGERPARLQMTPVPLWYGSPHATARSNSGSSGQRQSAVNRPHVIYHPPQIPHSVPVPGTDLERRGVGVAEEGIGPGVPWGLLPLPGNDSTRVAQVVPGPPPPAEHKKRIIRPTDIQEALLMHRIQPVYPPLAVHTHIEGRVQLHAIIGRDGAVKSLEVSSGHPVLARAALEAVSQWRYRPTLLNGEPVEVETYITVIFQLQR